MRAEATRELTLLEFERAPDESGISFSNIYRRINASIARIEAARDVAELCDTVAAQVRQLTGLRSGDGV